MTVFAAEYSGKATNFSQMMRLCSSFSACSRRLACACSRMTRFCSCNSTNVSGIVPDSCNPKCETRLRDDFNQSTLRGRPLEDRLPCGADVVGAADGGVVRSKVQVFGRLLQNFMQHGGEG